MYIKFVGGSRAHQSWIDVIRAAVFVRVIRDFRERAFLVAIRAFFYLDAIPFEDFQA